MPFFLIHFCSSFRVALKSAYYWLLTFNENHIITRESAMFILVHRDQIGYFGSAEVDHKVWKEKNYQVGWASMSGTRIKKANWASSRCVECNQWSPCGCVLIGLNKTFWLPMFAIQSCRVSSFFLIIFQNYTDNIRTPCICILERESIQFAKT